jgi:hypothetical protein
MALTKADWMAQAEEAGLTVTRADGRTDLEPTAADYKDAVEAWEKANAPTPEPEPEPAEMADYRILVAAGPMSGLEGTITMARDEGDGWVQLGWLEPANVE